MYAQEHSDNCGIVLLTDFDYISKNFLENLAGSINESGYFWESYGDRNRLNFGIVHFSGTKKQKGLLAFRTWLRRQQEKVLETKWASNPNSGNKIKSFLWVPSYRFKQRLLKELRKQNPVVRDYW